MILLDPEFKEIMPQIRHENVAVLIDDALHTLHHGPKPTDKHTPFEIYTDACMVIAVLTQWIIGYLCKHLMQLMTPEALTVHCKDFPTVYIQNYLKFQEHFSLKELVHSCLEDLMRNKW